MAIGGTVRATLTDGSRALVTALGPTQTASAPATHTGAVIKLRIAATRGTITATGDELTSRDDTGRAVSLHPVGPSRIAVPAGTTKTLTVVGTYTSGSAQLTWRHDGKVMAVWAFTIELD